MFPKRNSFQYSGTILKRSQEDLLEAILHFQYTYEKKKKDVRVPLWVRKGSFGIIQLWRNNKAFDSTLKRFGHFISGVSCNFFFSMNNIHFYGGGICPSFRRRFFDSRQPHKMENLFNGKIIRGCAETFGGYLQLTSLTNKEFFNELLIRWFNFSLL